MKGVIPFLGAVVLAQGAALSQEYIVRITGLNSGRAALLALSGEKSTLVDSVTATGDGTFSFRMTEDQPAGMYRLFVGRGKSIDFIHDGEDVDIGTEAGAPAESIRVAGSESNRLYYEFRRLNQQFKTKSEILQLVLARYPRDDPYYAATRATAQELQRGYTDFIESASTTRRTSFVARYIRSAQLPVVDVLQLPERQLAWLKAHALDHVDFADEGLIHSDLFASKTIEYLMYFRNPQLPKELLAREFHGAVDSILNRAKVNQAVYRHITEYLIDGFKQFGFEECISYILENYVIKDDLCLEGSGNTIQRMIDQKKRLPVGAAAPGIVLPDTAGRQCSLGDVTGAKTLVVFYSTTCPHCQSALPRLSALVREKGRVLNVVAVALDADIEAWLAFIRLHDLAWTNLIDVRGWSGKAAEDYSIYATPTMFLLDGGKRIIAKPMTVDELKTLL